MSCCISRATGTRRCASSAPTKNRYGAADEVGCFEMREDGIAGLSDPSGLFLSDRAAAVPGTCVAVTQRGPPADGHRDPGAGRARGVGGGSLRRAVSIWMRRGWRCCSRCSAATRDFRVADSEMYAATVGGIAATEPAADLAIALALASAARDSRSRRRCAPSARCRCPETSAACPASTGGSPRPLGSA